MPGSHISNINHRGSEVKWKAVPFQHYGAHDTVLCGLIGVSGTAFRFTFDRLILAAQITNYRLAKLY